MKRFSGFTLIELLVTIGVAAILAAIAVPAYNHLVSGNRVVGAVNDLAASLGMARSEAITRGERVGVCPSEQPLVDSPVCSQSGWSKGWLVYADPDDNGTYDGKAENLIRVHGPVGKISMPDPSRNHYVAFNRMGFAQPTFKGSGKQKLTIIACPPGGRDANARALVLVLAGSITTSARKADGGSYTCP